MRQRVVNPRRLGLDFLPAPNCWSQNYVSPQWFGLRTRVTKLYKKTGQQTFSQSGKVLECLLDISKMKEWLNRCGLLRERFKILRERLSLWAILPLQQGAFLYPKETIAIRSLHQCELLLVRLPRCVCEQRLSNNRPIFLLLCVGWKSNPRLDSTIRKHVGR